MKCRELIKELSEYVDGTLDENLCAELEQHLEGCNPCQLVVDNVKKTITLFKNGEPYELPEAFRAKLHANLKQKWAEKHTASADEDTPDS